MFRPAARSAREVKLGPGKWRVVLEGDTDAFLMAGGRSRAILAHQLERMVAGDEFTPAELAYWGIAVEEQAK